MTPTFGCVILTMGKRPKEFAAALESLKNQSGVDLISWSLEMVGTLLLKQLE